jgi:hypothetical protein
MAKAAFKKGDIVRYTAKFLRNTGWHTGVPVNGRVRGVSKLGENDLVDVAWSDGENRKVLAVNLMRAGDPDYSGMGSSDGAGGGLMIGGAFLVGWLLGRRTS